MVYRQISQDIKERALWLLEHDHIPEDVAYLLGVSQRSIQRWERNVDIYGSVIPPHNPLQGRPPLLDTEAKEDIIALSIESPELFLDEIQDWLAVAHSVAISRSQLHQIIRDCSITYKLLRRAASERDEEARSRWRLDYQEQYSASQLLFVDESSKDDRTIYRHYGRSVAGERATIPANFVRGERYSLVAALGLEGYAAARVVPGSLDGDEFFDFIVNDVVCVSVESRSLPV